MTRMEPGAVERTGQRDGFDRKISGLRGRRVTGVQYWDVHNYSSEPSPWDYGNWHHAVMGLELATDSGPVTVTWTSTFHDYGVEVFLEPIARHLLLGEDGPQPVGPDALGPWEPLMGSPIMDAMTWWERCDSGPPVRGDATMGTAPWFIDVPTALRLDFAGGSVWFVAAILLLPSGTVSVSGDEIMVVFSAARMRSLGFHDPSFVA